MLPDPMHTLPFLRYLFNFPLHFLQEGEWFNRFYALLELIEKPAKPNKSKIAHARNPMKPNENVLLKYRLMCVSLKSFQVVPQCFPTAVFISTYAVTISCSRGGSEPKPTRLGFWIRPGLPDTRIEHCQYGNPAKQKQFATKIIIRFMFCFILVSSAFPNCFLKPARRNKR